MAIANATDWLSLPSVGEPLTSVIHRGNGKDAELQLLFADGRSATLGVHRVRVETDRGIVVDVSGWGDTELVIKYSGPGLYLHSGRFSVGDLGRGYNDAEWVDEWRAGFLDEAQSWLAAGGDGEFLWTVEVELRLASRSSDLPAPRSGAEERILDEESL